MSVTQVVYKDLLGMADFEPPEPKGKKTKHGADEKCWLCAGETNGKGWHVKDAISSAFTDTSLAHCPQSQTICDSCVALMKREAWEIACEKHGHSPYFPAKDDKKPALANWMFSSHVFSKEGWLRPDRKDIAEILLDPPKPPFVITLADVGKKHVIFKSHVSYSQDDYFVNIDETTISVNRSDFAELLDIVENAYRHFSKDSLLTGDYNQAAVLKAGLSVWREIEGKINPFRQSKQELLRLACFVARKAE